MQPDPARRPCRASVIPLAFTLAVLHAASTAAQAPSDYLPLKVGNRWELVSRSAPSPMAFEVTGREGDAFVVRWDNPWVEATFRFTPQNGRVVLAALDMGQGAAPMPPGTVYFDFTQGAGQSWTNAVGTMTVMSRDDRVTANGVDYQHCIEIRTTDNKKQSMYWTFAPGVGFVRFGQGKDAFLLTRFQTGVAPSTTRERSSAPTGQAVPRRGPVTTERMLVGLDANPPESAGQNESAKREWLRKSIDAGVTFIYTSPTWAGLEPSEGQYRFDEVDREADAASQFGLPIVLNLRVIDTNNRATPKPYSRWSLDDEKLAEKLIEALRAIAPRTKGRVRWVQLGNEVGAYFGSHRRELDAYVRLLTRVLPTVRQLFPGAGFSVSFGLTGQSQLDRYGALTDLFDYYAFTYYPLNPDFSMRPPDTASADIDRIVAAAHSRPVLFQEIGYASASRLNSSEQKQADFVRDAFAALERHRGQVIGANFLFMSDLPSGVVDMLGGYYRAGNNENFKAYLATLGLFDSQGRPKPAWQVFVTEARRLSSERR